jgi:hypothetical protein
MLQATRYGGGETSVFVTVSFNGRDVPEPQFPTHWTLGVLQTQYNQTHYTFTLRLQNAHGQITKKVLITLQNRVHVRETQ